MSETELKSRETTNVEIRILALGHFSLLVGTWPLWTPQLVFPQIPLIAQFGSIPRSFEWGLLGVSLVSLAVMAFAERPDFRRWASFLNGFCAFVLVGIDQHRLQPWVWQFLVLSLVLSVADRMTALAAWRWLVVGIYSWSAWSKIDYGFCLQHGQFLWDGLCKSIGLIDGTRNWPEGIRIGFAAAIPVFELSIAIGLCFVKTRRTAFFGAAIMHLGLLLALGPVGHNHRPGVLIWNVFFLVQNWVLFRPQLLVGDCSKNSMAAFSPTNEQIDSVVKLTPTAGDAVRCGRVPGQDSRSVVNRPTENLTRESAVRVGNSLAWIAVLSAVAWPILEPFGYCDHWPAWAVYASKPERVTMSIHEEDLANLPDEFKRYVGVQSIPDEWHPLRIDRWSLDTVMAPVYSQDRFHVGVAIGVARNFHLHRIRLVIESSAHRWTGKRFVQSYDGLEIIERLSDSYRCGAQPR